MAEILDIIALWYGMVWYGMVWYGMVWYGGAILIFVNTLYIYKI